MVASLSRGLAQQRLQKNMEWVFFIGLIIIIIILYLSLIEKIYKGILEIVFKFNKGHDL